MAEQMAEPTRRAGLVSQSVLPAMDFTEMATQLQVGVEVLKTHTHTLSLSARVWAQSFAYRGQTGWTTMHLLLQSLVRTQHRRDTCIHTLVLCTTSYKCIKCPDSSLTHPRKISTGWARAIPRNRSSTHLPQSCRRLRGPICDGAGGGNG